MKRMSADVRLSGGRRIRLEPVQAANSGHPGTPMAMAPVAYALWQHVPALRSGGPDLAQPRPLRAVGRPRVDAALLAAAPDRRQGGQPGLRAARASRRCRSTTSSSSASSTARARATRSTAGPRASRPPPARSARAWRPASAWRSPAAGWPRTSTGPASSCSTTTSTRSCGDGCMMEGISAEAASLAGHLELDEPVLDLRQQPHHHRGPHRASRSATTSRRASSATAGTSRGSATPTTCEMLDARVRRRSSATTDRPTLIIVDSHIGYGAPNKQDTSAAHGEPLGVEEIRLDQAHYGWPEDAQFLVPDGVREHFAAGIGARGRDAARGVGWSYFERYRAEYPELADQLAAHAAARAARTAGTPSIPELPARREGPGRRARRRRQGAQCDRQAPCRG